MKTRGVTHAVYFFTRDMKFKAYNITGYLDTGVFNLIYEIQLNQTFSNAECRDLTFFSRDTPYVESFEFVCKDYVLGGYDGRQLMAQFTFIHLNKTMIDKNYAAAKNVSTGQPVLYYAFLAGDLSGNIDFD